MRNQAQLSFFLTLKNYIALSKPRIAFFCLIMTAGGFALAPTHPTLMCFSMTLIGTALSVASANAFNMIYERNTDKLMRRTKFRPLAMGKIRVLNSIFFAVGLGVSSFVLLYAFVNLLTALLALGAIVFYGAIYTPLKTKTPLALVIGAFPGAMPPLLGWTGATNKVTIEGLLIFGILFAWQMPHFIAIAIYHKEDYARAGIRVVPVVRGETAAKWQAFLWSLALLSISLILVLLKVGGIVYFLFAVVLGVWFSYLSFNGLTKNSPTNWPRKFFLASLVYLPMLTIGLIVDRMFFANVVSPLDYFFGR